MDLGEYNQDVTDILKDTIRGDQIRLEDLECLVGHVVRTIRMYDERLSQSELTDLVYLIIRAKYSLVLSLNPDSELNKVRPKPKPVPSSDDYELEEIDMTRLKLRLQRSRDLIDDSPEKVTVSCAEDLICRRYDYPGVRFTEEEFIRRCAQIARIDQIPQHEQKSKKWLAQRKKCLTATAVAIVLDHDPYSYPFELLLDKCDLGKPFVENANVHHGKKYEEIGTMTYSYRNNVRVGEYGLLQHPENKFIAASPDGICQKKRLHETGITSLVGRLLEIKFPSLRKIVTQGKLDGDLCPHHYYVQCQTQLYVTQLDECDFLQCEVDEYSDWKEYVEDCVPGVPGLSAISGLEKGCLIQLLPKDMIGGDSPEMCLYNAAYIYPPRLHMSPDEIKAWIATSVIEFPDDPKSKKFVIDKVIYWRLRKTSCNLVKADTAWFESIIPMLRQFWDYVEFYRENIELLEKLKKYAERVGMGESADLFRRINKQYVEAHPKSKYRPLYQETNPWREAAEIKRAKREKWLAYEKRRGASS